MKFYYHHVGKPGASSDFPRTVFQTHSIQNVALNVPEPTARRAELLQDLARAFPNGHFNCWGVPSGARNVIKNLAVGDVVLLIDDLDAGDSGIPALCEVKVYLPIELPHLSEFLWKDTRYPYIFFFNTVRLNLNWPTFASHVGFKPNYNPRGMFLSVLDAKLADKGGAAGYMSYLRENHSG